MLQDSTDLCICTLIWNSSNAVSGRRCVGRLGILSPFRDVSNSRGSPPSQRKLRIMTTKGGALQRCTGSSIYPCELARRGDRLILRVPELFERDAANFASFYSICFRCAGFDVFHMLSFSRSYVQHERLICLNECSILFDPLRNAGYKKGAP